MTRRQLNVPAVFKPLWMNPKRSNYLYGGRGSGKSTDVAQYIIERGRQTKLKILCTRELQKSIADSVHALLKDQISKMGYDDFFDVQNAKIIGKNGTQFIFAGVRSNVNEIKSMEGVDICWVEEAQAMSQQSIDVLVPTIRKPGSILIYTFNPFKDSDPIYKAMELAKEDENSLVIKANWRDNPFFPDVLKLEMEKTKKMDYDKYLWVWEGECLGISAAQIFRGKYKTQYFETPSNAEFHFGADWGFANDPTAILRSFVVGNTLYIDYAAGRVGCDIDETPDLFRQVPGNALYPIYADSARPETISYMNAHGFNVVGADKYPGSVEDGIAYLRSFDEIIIHPRCPEVVEEFDLYQYKVDKQTDEILREPMDKFNHFIDALRYAYTPYMRKQNVGKVYEEFKIQNIVKPIRATGEVFMGTYSMPGRTLVLFGMLNAGKITIFHDTTQNGQIDFQRLKEQIPADCNITWMPYLIDRKNGKMASISQDIIDSCEAADIEPAVGTFYPSVQEAAHLVNSLFKGKSLELTESANLTISCLNARVYLAEGKLAGTTKETENDRRCVLLEYLVWRIMGRLGEESFAAVA